MSPSKPKAAKNRAKVIRPTIVEAEPSRFDDVTLTVTGRQSHKRGWVHHRFDTFAVGLVVRGGGTYAVDDGPVQPIEAPALFAVYPGPTFHYGPKRGTTWDEWHVGVSGEGVSRWRRRGWLPTDGRVHAIDDARPAVAAFRELLKLKAGRKRGDADRAVVAAQRVLVEIYYARKSIGTAGEHSEAIERVLETIRERHAEAIDFEQLAADHHMSYSQLRKQVKIATGMPPAKLLAHVRCAAAKRLLAETTQPVSIVGQRVGIDDPYLFSRVFRRTVGLPPRGFREQARAWAGEAE